MPVDLPPFLAGLLAAPAYPQVRHQCVCADQHDVSGWYVFLSPGGLHYRRSNYARRVFRPACDGRYEPVNGRPGKLVIVDAAAWPGIPIGASPVAEPGVPFTPPTGRGTARLVSTDSTGRCPICGYAVKLRSDRRIVAHKLGSAHCPGSAKRPR